MNRTPSSRLPLVPIRAARPAGTRVAAGSLILTTLITGALLLAAAGPAVAASATVQLGTAASYSVLGGQTVTNTGPSRLSGNLGVSPGRAVTGFPPGRTAGATHKGDASALQAKADLVTAYDDAAGRAPNARVAGDLVGRTLNAGVYKSTGPLALSGTVTLNAQGDPNSVFIFQIAKTLITASASYVKLVNGAQACNVFWQVGSSATLGTASVFRGSILALQSISVTTHTVVEGRALARNGAVTLDNDTFRSPACGTGVDATPSTTTLSVHPKTVTAGQHATATATVRGASRPSGMVRFQVASKVVGWAQVNSAGRATVTLPAVTKPGTRSVTATYTGSADMLPSTAARASLIVRAARKAAAATTTAPSTPTPARSTAPLAATGATHLNGLLPTAAAAIAIGLGLTWTARRQRPAQHRR